MAVIALCGCTYNTYVVGGTDADGSTPPDAELPIDAHPPTCATGGCSEPTATTVCIQGTVRSFENSTGVGGVTVRAYDAIAFISDPTSPPIATGLADDTGCFIIDGVARPASGLVAVAVDAGCIQAGAGAALQPNANVTDLTVYDIGCTTLQGWETQTGAPFSAHGLWIGLYENALGDPIAGVTPSRPGDPIPPSNLFCFRGDRLHLVNASTTDATGGCVISPDDTLPHSGMGPCPFSPFIGGSSAGLIWFQTLRCSM